MSHILFTGAPGSKWSGIVGDIYRSKDIDQTDYSKKRKFKNRKVNHHGVYFDPGFEFDNKKEMWDLPFSGKGKRIIKSHTFAYQLNELKKYKLPIVMVYRNCYECYKWWHEAGGFDIEYPNYKPYYKNSDNMWCEITSQNTKIMQFVKDNEQSISRIQDTYDLCSILNIKEPKDLKWREYSDDNIQLYVWLN